MPDKARTWAVFLPVSEESGAVVFNTVHVNIDTKRISLKDILAYRSYTPQTRRKE